MRRAGGLKMYWAEPPNRTWTRSYWMGRVVGDRHRRDGEERGADWRRAHNIYILGVQSSLAIGKGITWT